MKILKVFHIKGRLDKTEDIKSLSNNFTGLRNEDLIML